MSEAKKRVPKRRFKEFLNTGDWEQRKLGNIVDFLDGQRKPLKESDRIKGKYPYYGASGIIDYINDYLFDENLVLLSEDGANIIDRNYPICFIATGKYWVNNHAHVLKVKAGVIDKFICESLERLDYTKFNTGTAQPKLNQDICQKIVITIPNEDEQKCISEFLDRINNIITLHQSKLDKLQATKKALLQEMFPEEGQDKPKRRFKGFSDAWEQRKLGDIATITGGGTPSTNISEYWNGDIDWYSPVEIGEKRYASGSIRKITKLGLEKSSAKILPVGTVLFTSRAGIGNTAILQVEGCTNQGFQSITPNSKELDTYFLYTMTPKLKRYGEVTGAGSTFVEVSGKQMEQMNLMIPSLDEQKHVSQLFKVMDDAITLHQRKLDKLKNLKQAYLNEMFV